MSAPANTVARTSGRRACCSAIAIPGRALPAAHPHTEFTTSINVPRVFLTASSTAAAVFSSLAPIAVISPRIGAINISGYGIFFCSLLPAPCSLLPAPCCLLPAACPAPCRLLPLHHRVALRLELVPRLPLRQLVGIRHAVADGKEQLRVFDGAAQIPVRLHLVRRGVVVVLGVFVALLLSPVRGLADEVDTGVGVERGHSLLGEIEMVRPVVEALLGFRIRRQRAPLFLRRLAQVVVEV